MGTTRSPEKDPGCPSMPDINASFVAVLRVDGGGGVPALERPGDEGGGAAGEAEGMHYFQASVVEGIPVF